MTGGSVAEFQAHRGRLFGLAYRLLGSAEEAEDALQEAYLRWTAADRAAIEAPGGWLAKVVTNLCLNRLTSARARRERYVGPWLPEPVITTAAELGPLDTAEQRDLVSLGLLRLMETLTPTERAVFVLREAFGYSHREIAGIVPVTEANSRQLHTRARRRLARPDTAPSGDGPGAAGSAGAAGPGGRRGGSRVVDKAGWRALVERFLRAAAEGDLASLEDMLAADVVSVADGGGRTTAARRPVAGRDRVARYLAGAFGTGMARLGARASYAEVNGEPAALGWAGESLLGAIVLSLDDDGRIAALHIAANPDKLRFAAGQLSHPVELLGS